jgi:hypothetical protein
MKSGVLGWDVPLHDRRSLRLLAMADPSLFTDAELHELDERLAEVGPRSDGPSTSVSLPAWPPPAPLTVREVPLSSK